MNTNRYTLLMLFYVLSLGILNAQTTITDDDLVGNQNHTWSNDTEYMLDGYVFLEEGGTLTIEPGTIIRGKANPTTGDQSSALIITRGAQIFANGTADAPVIFTTEFDDVNNANDLTKADKGLWGGLIILGNGIVGEDGGTDNIEGIPSTEGRATYGGSRAEDSSGSLTYVSIRHGGSKLEANNEINGLTLGGVGNGTTIDYIEVYANLDDGIEFFGGSVNVRHAVVSFCGDDSYDIDESWDGKGQFWFGVQDELSNRSCEWDGSEKADLTPKASHKVSNMTLIGGGATSTNEDGNDALRIRDDASANVYNSIFVGFADGAIQMDNDVSEDLPNDSYQRFLSGDMTFDRNLFFDFGDGNDLASIVGTDGGDDNLLVTHLTDRGNSYEDPILGGISRTNDNGLDPRPSNGSPALGDAVLIDNDFFDPVPYRGAFPNDNNWALKWTALDDNGYFGDLAEPAETRTIVVKDTDINANDKVTWTADNEYVLDGYVFVENGACLTINPGTIIKGKASPTTGDRSSALIIARGGQIVADGTADRPIIFTAEFDDVNNPDDLTQNDKGLWGGLIILGNGIVGEDGGTDNIEGIPSTEGRAEYGGTDNADNSGVLRYVSIRHGGDKLEANNEINGLTLGGVGNGTIIDYIEVFANLDDGIELFGGAVDIRHAVVSFCGDDSYDIDESWDGNGQYWFGVQDELSNRTGEWDGSEKADLTPKASPDICNGTFIGAGATSVNEDGNDALRIRDDAAANVYNSVFIGFAGRGIVMDNDVSQDLPNDSYQRFLAGDINFGNNLFFDMGAGDAFADIVSTDGGDDNLLVTHLEDNGNQMADPGLGSISRIADGGLDPRVDARGSAYGAGMDVNSDYCESSPHIGAFGTENWADGWTALAANGYFGDFISSTNDPSEDAFGNKISNIYPNPIDANAVLKLELASSANVSIGIVDVNGRLIAQVARDQHLSAGTRTIPMDVSAVPQGLYFVTVQLEASALTHKIMVIR